MLISKAKSFDFVGTSRVFLKFKMTTKAMHSIASVVLIGERICFMPFSSIIIGSCLIRLINLTYRLSFCARDMASIVMHVTLRSGDRPTKVNSLQYVQTLINKLQAFECARDVASILSYYPGRGVGNHIWFGCI